MIKRILVLVAGLSTFAAAFADNITATQNPDKAPSGKVIEVRSDQVTAYCNFKEQIVKIGYDKKDNIIMACVKN